MKEYIERNGVAIIGWLGILLLLAIVVDAIFINLN